VTGSRGGIGLACARLRERRSNIVFNGMGAPAEVEKERSAIKNDFGVKSVYSPAESNATAWRRKRTSARP
jgi:3-hydroxybutyrate dehydrogenase